MIYCTKCGKENDDNSTFCAVCGAPFSFANRTTPQPTPQPTPSSTTSNTAGNTSGNATYSTSYSTPNPAINNTTGTGRFVSKDEVAIATLSNGFTDNIITGEGFKHEDAIVTNKRLYYNHKQGIINIVRVEEKIDIEDITGTKILSVNCLGLLIASCILFICSLIGIAIDELVVFASIFASALILLVVYFISLKKHLLIEYAGGSISFSVRGYRMSNIQAFQKAIYVAKDKLKESK